jgi:hypothetical protein
MLACGVLIGWLASSGRVRTKYNYNDGQPFPPGDCGPACPSCCDKNRLTWWFLPRPKALHDALWTKP